MNTITTAQPTVCARELAQQTADALIAVAVLAHLDTCLNDRARHAWDRAVPLLESDHPDERRGAMCLILDAIAATPGAASGLLRGISGALDA